MLSFVSNILDNFYETFSIFYHSLHVWYHDSMATYRIFAEVLDIIIIIL